MRTGSSVFLVDGGHSVSFAQLLADVDRVAAGLAARGIGPGDRIAIALDNRIEWVQTLFAAARLGAIMVTLNVRYRESELLFMLGDSGASMLISEARSGDFAFPALHDSLRDRLPDLETIVYVEAPEGAGLLGILPFNHVGGVTCTLLAMLLGGGQVILVRAFSPSVAMGLAREHRITGLTGVPMMMKLMLAELAPGETLPVRLAISGGSNVEPALFRALTAAAPEARLFNLYGLSESSGAAVMSGTDDDEQTLLTTLGLALDGVEARVVDADGVPVAAGVDGELQLRGASIADGYWDRPEEHPAVVPDDAGRQDSQSRTATAGSRRSLSRGAVGRPHTAAAGERIPLG
ncbi:AMP-binding protein [Gordonia alkaliphila]|uniref:class I adenylate-forming enzyme family protein n=1 Tax=Gordonia alkaliphila TaxID=1053547 RepID=UPI001FF33C6D|nr:AMP-binding protein [Gordonia alkaliphila]MCK0440826.1 AMP-binding protein [Gordonia alkaliphila]